MQVGARRRRAAAGGPSGLGRARAAGPAGRSLRLRPTSSRGCRPRSSTYRPRRRSRPPAGGQRSDPAVSAGIPVRGVLQGVLRAPGARAWRGRADAPRHLAGLGLRHRSRGPRRDQQSRHCRGRRGAGHAARRHHLRSRDPRPRPGDRPRRAAHRPAGAAARGGMGRFRPRPGRRLDPGDRQSLRAREHGDRRHHLGAGAGHQRRLLRRLPADRRVDQSRQFRRPDVQPRRRGHRHQHRDLLAFRRQRGHRLRDPDGAREAADRPARHVWTAAARLARRAHPDGDRRDRRGAGHDRGQRRAGRRRRRGRAGESRGHRGRRRDPDLRRQAGRRDAQAAAAGGRVQRRQGGRGRGVAPRRAGPAPGGARRTARGRCAGGIPGSGLRGADAIPGRARLDAGDLSATSCARPIRWTSPSRAGGDRGRARQRSRREGHPRRRRHRRGQSGGGRLPGRGRRQGARGAGFRAPLGAAAGPERRGSALVALRLDNS